MPLTGEFLRQAALSLYRETDWAKHPCRIGKGRCCEPTTPLNPHDEWIIKTAIERREISRETLESAKQRLTNNPARCCFLNEQNGCSIYQFRPVTCIITGTAGMPTPRDKETIRDLDRIARKQIHDVRVPVANTTTTMCSECANELIARKATFSGRMMVVFNFIHQGFASGFKQMDDFVKTL